MRKRVVFMVIALVVVIAAGWGTYQYQHSASQDKAQSAKVNSNSKHANSKTNSSNSSVKATSAASSTSNADGLSVDSMTPQQTVATLMYYTAHTAKLKYIKSWSLAFDNANIDRVYITTTAVSGLAKQGQNVRYAVASSQDDPSTPAAQDYLDPSYTLDSDGTVNFYDNQDIGTADDNSTDGKGRQVEPLARVSLTKMVNFANAQGAADQIKTRATKLTVVDKRYDSEKNTSNNLTEQDIGSADGYKMLLLYAVDHYHMDTIKQALTQATFDVHVKASVYTYVMEQGGVFMKVGDQQPRADPKIPGYFMFMLDKDKSVGYSDVLKYVNAQGGRQALQNIKINIVNE